MKKRKKSMLLSIIIVVLVIVLITMVYEIIVEEKNRTGEEMDISCNEVKIENPKEESNVGELEAEPEISDTEEIEKTKEIEKTEEVGNEEENESENTTQNVEQKVIDIVKKQWGEDDDSVTVTIEKKNGTKYRAAVRDASTTVLQWYEVDTENWKISEY